MSNDATKVYEEVCQYARRTAALAAISEMLGWDERTHLPPAGGCGVSGSAKLCCMWFRCSSFWLWVCRREDGATWLGNSS